MKNIPTIVPVVAAALIDGDGRVLMQRRRLAAEHGGLWEFPGGKVETGETLAQSLCRELSEELGIAVSAESLRPLSFASRDGLPYVILLYTCQAWTGVPTCLDGEEIAWFEPSALAMLAMPPLDVPLASALCDFLQGRPK